MDGQRVDEHRVQVAFVDGVSNGHIGPQTHAGSWKRTPARRGNRCLPWHGVAEWDGVVLPRPKREGTSHRETGELDARDRFRVTGLHLHS